jgi:uncharacterized protein (DUF4415 family)
MKDEDINLSENAEIGDSFFKNATLRLPEPKRSVSLRIDDDVLEWYKHQGPGYQTRINAVLRMYMQAKSGIGKKVPRKRKIYQRKLNKVGRNKENKRTARLKEEN